MTAEGGCSLPCTNKPVDASCWRVRKGDVEEKYEACHGGLLPSAAAGRHAGSPAGILDPCHSSEAVFPGACKVQSRWVAAIFYSRIDINPGMVMIFTSLQRLFECHPGWQINLFSLFKNVTKSFS